MRLINHQQANKFKTTKSNCVIFLSVFFIFFETSCKKFVQVDPPDTRLVNSTVFTNDATATAAIDGLYGSMWNMGYNFSLVPGLSADEFKDYTNGSAYTEIYTNQINVTNATTRSLWGTLYNNIYQANAIIAGASNSTGITQPAKKQIIAEARFIRAFNYFYLINLFGDVPYNTTTDYLVTSTASRTPKDQIYQQIISELKDLQNDIKDFYVSANDSTSTTERIRANKWVAKALLARTYLYTGDWVNAEIESSAIINNTSTYTLVSDPNLVFQKNSTEAIWQLMPSQTGYNTFEGSQFILTTAPTQAALSLQLVNAFESNDSRKSKWIGSLTIGASTYFFPYKYKIKLTGQALSEYAMVFRLAEQFLIRAEARAHQNNLSGAITDLNIIRNRAALTSLPNTLNQAQVLAAVEQERNVELFTEWGHRWLDLKRTNRADAVLAPIKGSAWQSTDALYPIPQSDILVNFNLTQNPGY